MYTDELARRCAMTGTDIHAWLPTLHDEASRPGVVVIELGVRTGMSTAAFLAAVTAQSGELWSVDPGPIDVPGQWYSEPRWHYLAGGDLDDGVLAALPAECDVLFIDTTHAYAQTVAELTTYGPRVRPGGVILLHDTELEHPEERDLDDPPYPVARAVEAWCDLNGLDVELRPGCYGLGVVRIP